MEIAELERFNSWWRTGKVREELTPSYRRHLYSKVKKFLDTRQSVLLYGLRRVGKTTMMYQMISDLLSINKPIQILYFSFDEKRYNINEVLETYQVMILHNVFENIKERIYIFFDEIQKIADWEETIKVYYDLYPNLKFVFSGSASIVLRKNTSESLAGRVFSFLLGPLLFSEFLEMQGKDVREILANSHLWEREIRPLFIKYLKYGTFPELVNTNDEEIARQYIKNNVIEKIVYKDIPQSFGLTDIDLLKALVEIIIKNPGMLINYASLSRDFNRDQRTVMNYLNYLEFGLIIRFVFNYRGSFIASRRKMRKAYPVTPNLSYAFSENLDGLMPKMLETVVGLKNKTKFFYRNSFEVDYIVEDGDKLIGIEIKSTERDARQLLKLGEKFGEKVKELVLLTDGRANKVERITIMPVWLYCLIGEGEVEMEMNYG